MANSDWFAQGFLLLAWKVPRPGKPRNPGKPGHLSPYLQAERGL